MSGEDFSHLASIAKVFGARAVIDTAIDGAQIGGTYGMLEESQYLMILQDSVGCTVGGGTEEIHCNEIFQWLKSQASQGTLYRESAPNLQTMKPEIC